MEAQGLDIVFRVRPNDQTPPTPWQELVCEIDNQAELDNEVTETDTKCGTFTGVKDVKGNISGNAVANAVPTNLEASSQDLAVWQKNKTLLDFEYYNRANGSVPQGSVVYRAGSGYFTNSVVTGTVGEVVQFSWTFSPSGDIDVELNS